MANIKSLEGKYYGTIIELEDGSIITVWVGNKEGEYKASQREIDNGWTPDIGFDHVESERDWRIASVICNSLNKIGE